MPNEHSDTYGVEGVMPNFTGGWLLALDRPFAGSVNDMLAIRGAQPPVTLRVRAIVPPDAGPSPDILVAPVADLYDPRLLVGRTLEPAADPQNPTAPPAR